MYTLNHIYISTHSLGTEGVKWSISHPESSNSSAPPSPFDKQLNNTNDLKTLKNMITVVSKMSPSDEQARRLLAIQQKIDKMRAGDMALSQGVSLTHTARTLEDNEARQAQEEAGDPTQMAELGGGERVRGKWEGIEISHKDLANLTKMAWAEAKGEGIEGMLDVAATILNRIKSSKFPNTVNEVIFAKYYNKKLKRYLSEFSPVDDGNFQKAQVDPKFIEAFQTMFTQGKDPINGATFFQTDDLHRKGKNWMAKQTVVAQKGGHVFYTT